jgi:hypothetical protein
MRDRLSYASRFCHVLEERNASGLFALTPDVKAHAMKALASLSKFLGVYDEWLDLIKRHQLKWAKPVKSVKAFKSIFNSESEGKNLNSMMGWIKEVSQPLPEEYRNILLFNTLTGLRPDEAQKALHLIKTKGGEYIDSGRGLLRHYQYPNIFLRQTKNAYISIINEDILEIARTTPIKENYYPSLRKRISITNDFDMNMYYCRKVFATFLRNKGIEPQIIDLLQGRIASSVFVNHYYRPDMNDNNG